MNEQQEISVRLARSLFGPKKMAAGATHLLLLLLLKKLALPFPVRVLVCCSLRSTSCASQPAARVGRTDKLALVPIHLPQPPPLHSFINWARPLRAGRAEPTKRSQADGELCCTNNNNNNNTDTSSSSSIAGGGGGVGQRTTEVRQVRPTRAGNATRGIARARRCRRRRRQSGSRSQVRADKSGNGRRRCIAGRAARVGGRSADWRETRTLRVALVGATLADRSEGCGILNPRRDLGWTALLRKHTVESRRSSQLPPGDASVASLCNERRATSFERRTTTTAAAAAEKDASE